MLVRFRNFRYRHERMDLPPDRPPRSPRGRWAMVRSGTQETALEVMGLIQDAALEPSVWPSVAGRITEGADGFTLVDHEGTRYAHAVVAVF